MSAGTCASLCCALLFVGVSVCADQDIVITAEPGHNVVLPCRAPNNDSLRAVAWTKPALPDEHVYLYRDNRFDPEEQNPIFKNRVDLQDRQMKDGDVSLILKNVTVNDAGTYECRVVQRGPRSSFKEPTVSSISLRVDAPGQRGGGSRSGNGSLGLVVHLYVPVVLLAVAFWGF